MPKALRPGGRFPLALHSDRDLPADVRPTFYAVATSCERQMELAEQWEQLKDPDLPTRDLYNRTLDILWSLLVGWENMGEFNDSFSRESLGRLLDISEATELLAAAIWNNHVTPDEKKSLEQPH